MAFSSPIALIIALALGGVACRPQSPTAVKAELAACIPPDTLILAGIHLDSLRASPSFQNVAAVWMPLPEPLRNASSLLVAYNGKEMLLIASGQFPTAQAVTVRLTPEIALAGAASAVGAATAQHASGRTGVPSLVAKAAPVASQQIWAIVGGEAPLPVSGNRANFLRLLRLTDHVTLTVELNSRVAIEVAGFGRSEASAESLEGTLRGLVSLTAGATPDRDLATVLSSVKIRREALTVRAELSTTPAALQTLLREATR